MNQNQQPEGEPTSKRYIVQSGHTFRDSDNSLKTGGDEIELGDDVAAAALERGAVKLKPEPEQSTGFDEA